MPVIKYKKNGVWHDVASTHTHTHTSSDITDMPASLVHDVEVLKEKVGTNSVAFDINTAIESNKYAHPDKHPASMIEGLATVATTGSVKDLVDFNSTSVLPEVSSSDNGKVLGVSNGKWDKIIIAASGDGGGSYVQTDWNQIDSNSPDYIKNKPFYDYEGEVDIVSRKTYNNFTLDSSFNVYMVSNNGTIPLEIGQSYKVSWDDNEFNCEAIEVTGDLSASLPGFVIIGNGPALGLAGDNTAPFIIGTSKIVNLTFYVSLTDTTEGNSHEVRVYQDKILSKTIDQKYLPIPAFGKMYDTIFDYTFINENSADDMMCIGELPYALNAGQTYTVEWDGNVYQCDGIDLSPYGIPVVGLGNLAAIGAEDNGLPFAIAYDSVGISGTIGVVAMLVVHNDSESYHCTIKGDVNKKIDLQYLYQPDWNSNNSSNGSYIKNRPFSEVKANTVIVPPTKVNCNIDAIDGFGIGLIQQVGLIPGVKYNVVINGNTYSLIAIDSNGMVGVGDIETNGFVIADNFEGSGMSVMLNTLGLHEYSIIIAEDYITKLDTKYLPDGAGLPTVNTEDNGKTLIVTEGAWSVTEPVKGVPEVTADDNGKFLRVVNGVWSVDTVLNAEEVKF